MIPAATKFDALQHKRKQAWTCYRALIDEDEFPVAVLAGYSGMKQSTFYKYVAKDFEQAEVMPGEVEALLKENLAAKHQNYRLFYKDLPGEARIEVGEAPWMPNGLHDEEQDLAIAAGRLAVASRSQSPSEIRNVAAEMEDLPERLRREADKIEADKRRVDPVRKIAI
jgi:hypothetical protein